MNNIKEKVSSAELIKTRNKIFNIFKISGVDVESEPLKAAINNNRLTKGSIPVEKVDGSYGSEWKRLHNMVIETFQNMGRQDLANSFAHSVPNFTANAHPIDYIATLLKGAGSPGVTKMTQQKYAELEPLKGYMRDALLTKGIASPDSTDDIAQLFYNNFVAVRSNYNYDQFQPLDFANQKPGQHLDEAVTSAVVTYIKGLQEQKNAGKELPKVLDKIASAANEVQDQLTTQAKAGISKEIGGKILENSTLIIVAIVAVIGLVFYLWGKK